MNVHAMNAQEVARLAKVEDIDLLDTPPEPEFDRLSGLMRSTFGVEVAIISLIDARRLWVKSVAGAEITEIPRRDTICTHVVEQGDAMVVQDLSAHPDFCRNPFVCSATHLRFYAGAPLTVDGQHVGTVCLLDSTPRSFTSEELDQLLAYARIAADLVRVRQLRRRFDGEARLLSEGPVVLVTWRAKPGWPIEEASENLGRLLALDGETTDMARAASFWFDRLVHPDDRSDLRQVLMSHERTAGTAQVELDYRLMGPKGQTVWVRQFSRGEFDSAGRLRRVRGFLIEQTEQKQLELQIKTALDRLTLALDAGALGAWDCHIPTGTMMRTQKWASLLGMSLDEVEPSLLAWKTSVHPLDRPTVEKAWRDHLEGHTPAFEVEYRTRHKNGQQIWLHSFGRVIETDETGAPVRIVGTTRDVTQRHQELAQQEQQRRLLSLLNQAQQAFLLEKNMRKACDILLDPIISLSESQFGFIGEVFRDEADGHQYLVIRAISDITWDDRSEALYRLHAEGDLAFHNLDNLFGSTITTSEVVMTNAVSTHPMSRGTPAGHPFLDSFLGLPIMFGGEVLGMIGLANRIDGYDGDLVDLLKPLQATLGLLMHSRRLEQARMAVEQELERLARYDELTGVFNRRALLEAADGVLKDVRRHERMAHVAIIDLDHFKKINDTHGHAAGDTVLRTFARETRGLLRDTDVFGRIGGEEFAIILREAGSEDVEAVLERFRAHVEAMPVHHEGITIDVTLSMGVSRLCPKDATVDMAMARADEALYAAKAAGRNRIAYHEHRACDQR